MTTSLFQELTSLPEPYPIDPSIGLDINYYHDDRYYVIFDTTPNKTLVLRIYYEYTKENYFNETFRIYLDEKSIGFYDYKYDKKTKTRIWVKKNPKDYYYEKEHPYNIIDIRYQSYLCLFPQSKNTIIKTIKKSKLKNSNVHMYIDFDIFHEKGMNREETFDKMLTYIELWQQYPLAAKLTQYKFTKILDNFTNHHIPKKIRNDVLKGKTLMGAMGVNKKQFELIHKISPNHQGFSTLKTMFTIDPNATKQQYEHLSHVIHRKEDEDALIDMYNRFNISLDNVIQYTKKLYNKQYIIDYNTGFRLWYEYLLKAEELRLDLTEDKIKYPSHLRQEKDHLEFIEEQQKSKTA